MLLLKIRNEAVHSLNAWNGKFYNRFPLCLFAEYAKWNCACSMCGQNEALCIDQTHKVALNLNILENLKPNVKIFKVANKEPDGFFGKTSLDKKI